MAEEKVYNNGYFFVSIKGKLVRFQGFYNEFLKFTEGCSVRAVKRFRESANFYIEVFRGWSNGYIQGWEDCNFAVKDMYSLIISDSVCNN